MWVDRISGHSTPSGPSLNDRSYSPANRRPSHLSPSPQAARPGLARKGSSFLTQTLSPNDSTTSLPGTAQSANDSVLKQGAAKPRPSDIQDPIEVLNGITGKSKEDVPATENAGLVAQLDTKPERLVDDIDFGGLSLEEFVAKQDDTRTVMKSSVGAQTIQQFEQERDKFQDLHSAIFGCDDVSKSVETYLNDFQTELGAVSAEIESLQTRSVQLNAMLENRRNVEQLLGPAIEEISVSPQAVRQIAEGPIDENWVRGLNELETRTASIDAKISSSSSTKAIEDVRPLLTDIKNKVSVWNQYLNPSNACRL